MVGVRMSTDPPTRMPHGVSVFETHDQLVVRRWWIGKSAAMNMLLCAVWWTFVVVGYDQVQYDASTKGQPLTWHAYVFLGVFAAIGVVWSYITLALLANRTLIRVDMQQLRIRHGPLPWLGRRTLDPATIVRLVSESRRHVSRKHRHQYTHLVWVHLLDGRKVKLLSGLANERQAYFIEKRIEDFLSIKNRRVA